MFRMYKRKRCHDVLLICFKVKPELVTRWQQGQVIWVVRIFSKWVLCRFSRWPTLVVKSRTSCLRWDSSSHLLCLATNSRYIGFSMGMGLFFRYRILCSSVYILKTFEAWVLKWLRDVYWLFGAFWVKRYFVFLFHYRLAQQTCFFFFRRTIHQTFPLHCVPTIRCVCPSLFFFLMCASFMFFFCCFVSFCSGECRASQSSAALTTLCASATISAVR